MNLLSKYILTLLLLLGGISQYSAMNITSSGMQSIENNHSTSNSKTQYKRSHHSSNLNLTLFEIEEEEEEDKRTTSKKRFQFCSFFLTYILSLECDASAHPSPTAIDEGGNQICSTSDKCSILQVFRL